MAKGSVNVSAQCEELLGKIRSGEFSPVYLLMGDEPFYTDRLCTAIIENALDDFSRDFNETICYGADVDADTIITAARRFPMMAERQLVVVKDAQAMRDLEQLAVYCENPLDSTILVILMRGSSADKRKALYKQCSKNGVVVESNALRDYEMASWISSYFQERGLSIAPDAAALLAEYSGTNMSKIVVETDKLLKKLLVCFRSLQKLFLHAFLHFRSGSICKGNNKKFIYVIPAAYYAVHDTFHKGKGFS